MRLNGFFYEIERLFLPERAVQSLQALCPLQDSPRSDAAPLCSEFASYSGEDVKKSAEPEQQEKGERYLRIQKNVVTLRRKSRNILVSLYRYDEMSLYRNIVMSKYRHIETGKIK